MANTVSFDFIDIATGSQSAPSNTYVQSLGTWTTNPQIFSITLSYPPTAPYSIKIFDGIIQVAQDNGFGIIFGTDSGAVISGTPIAGTSVGIIYPTGVLNITFTGGTPTSGAITLQYNFFENMLFTYGTLHTRPAVSSSGLSGMNSLLTAEILNDTFLQEASLSMEGRSEHTRLMLYEPGAEIAINDPSLVEGAGAQHRTGFPVFSSELSKLPTAVILSIEKIR